MNLKMKKFPLSILALIFLANLLCIQSVKGVAISSNLTVNIAGLKNQEGQICFSLFDSSKGFPGDRKQALEAKCVKLKNASVPFKVGSVKAGSYAVAMFHDINSDGTLNRNSFGIPTEGFGFSGNPRVITGPPNFSESAVIVAGTNTNIDIQFQYFLEY